MASSFKLFPCRIWLSFYPFMLTEFMRPAYEIGFRSRVSNFIIMSETVYGTLSQFIYGL